MKKVISILLTIIWMIVIFMLSNQNSIETNNTTNIVYKIFGIENNSVIVFNLIRKLAHLIEYLILGLLVYNMLKNFNISNVIICSILICIIYSCTDEIHQLFIQGRECKITDCLIDVFGSSIGIFIYNLKQNLNKRLSKN